MILVGLRCCAEEELAMEGKGRRGRDVGKLRAIGREELLRVCRWGNEEYVASGDGTEGREDRMAAKAQTRQCE